MLELIKGECRNIITEAQGLLLEYRQHRQDAREQRRALRGSRRGSSGRNQQRPESASVSTTPLAVTSSSTGGGSHVGMHVSDLAEDVQTSTRKHRYSEDDDDDNDDGATLVTPTYSTYVPAVGAGGGLGGSNLSIGRVTVRGSGVGSVRESADSLFPEQVSPQQSVDASASRVGVSLGSLDAAGAGAGGQVHVNTSFTRRSLNSSSSFTDVLLQGSPDGSLSSSFTRSSRG